MSTTDINAYIRVARILSIEDVTKQGIITAKLIGDGENETPLTVYYTSPFYVPVDGEEAFSFTGFTGVPGVGAYILISNNPDDYKWYYLTTITGASYTRLVKSEKDDDAIVGGPDGDYVSPWPNSENDMGAYSHGPNPQKYTISSPKGGKFQISDSANAGDNQWFTKLESMTGKKVMASDSNDFISIETEQGDGLKITGLKYNAKTLEGPGPGPSAAELKAKQNIFIESDSGSLNADIKGGYQLNIRNQSANVPGTRPIAADTKVGEVNIESYGNSVNIVSYGTEFPQGGGHVGLPAIGNKGIFIDASRYTGVVQIKASVGGVEVWSEGDIDFNCKGNFNVNAAGDINLKSGSPEAKAYWGTLTEPGIKPLQDPYPPTTSVPGLGNINLNPPPGSPGSVKGTPTFSNDDLYPIN